jgi:AbrB family looped-hinge helix DNA binding protein
MSGLFPYKPEPPTEATVSSKGQITLPKAIRERLGIRTGSKIRFAMTSSGAFLGEPMLLTLDDLWKAVDAGPKPTEVMSFEEMDAAKARRAW